VGLANVLTENARRGVRGARAEGRKAGCYFVAMGFTGEPTAPVNGCGDASSKNS
jgi:hypothetical protein